MKEKSIFYRCSVCGNIVELMKKGGGKLVCCGKPMDQLEANTTDAAVEKHIPAAERVGDTIHVKVGSVEHPMTEEHHIEWIVVTDGVTSQRTQLTLNEKPEAVFAYKENAEIYAYCNLHGLWKVTL